MDLKATIEDITNAIHRQAEDAIESIRRSRDEFIRGVALNNEVFAAPPSISTADAACVIDGFQFNGGGTQVGLIMGGGAGGSANFFKAPPPGRYRAVVLLVRLPDDGNA